MRIYNKHDYMLDRDLRPRERLEPQRNTLNFIRHLCDSLENDLNNASDQLTENDLLTIADAVQYAYNAMENAAFLGTSGFHPRPVRPVRWGERDDKAKCQWSSFGLCHVSPDDNECDGTERDMNECAYCMNGKGENHDA